MVEQTDEEEVEHAVGPGQGPSRRRQGLRVCHSGQVLQELKREGARAEGHRDRGRERLPQEGSRAVHKVPREGLQVGHVIAINKATKLHLA